MARKQKPPTSDQTAPAPRPEDPAPNISAPAPRPIYISFTADVNPNTAEALMGAIGHHVAQGFNELHLMLSTPGGTVREGIAIYNLLRALPIRVVTYNVGSVNSIGNVVYLAGEHRLAAPVSSFMFHGVGFDIQNARMERKDLEEKLEGLMNDQRLIADVITKRTRITSDEADALFRQAAFVPAHDAKERGIVHEVADIDVPRGAPFVQLVFKR